jgi:hypothetical protein
MEVPRSAWMVKVPAGTPWADTAAAMNAWASSAFSVGAIIQATTWREKM